MAAHAERNERRERRKGAAAERPGGSGAARPGPARNRAARVLLHALIARLSDLTNVPFRTGRPTTEPTPTARLGRRRST